jgi:hypothetical protein
MRSPFAQQLSEARAEEQNLGRRLSRVPAVSRGQSFARSQQDLRIRQALGSRQNSRAGTPNRTPLGSRKNSHVASNRYGAKKIPVASRRNSRVGSHADELRQALSEKSE